MPQATLEEQVLKQIDWDDRVMRQDINVNAEEDGTITLTGQVSSNLARLSAEADAYRIPGVARVNNKIKVQYSPAEPAIDDNSIRSTVESVIFWNPDVNIADIRVTVTNGIVSLHGTVDAYWKKHHVEFLVYNVAGVSGIENELAVVPTHKITDVAIAENVMAALDRNAFVDGTEVDVEVEEGVVTLSGRVPSYTSYHQAYESALYAEGVVGIVDELNIVP